MHQYHPTVLVFVAVRYRKSLDGMVPKHTPLGSGRNIKARNFGAVVARGGQRIRPGREWEKETE
jgi:hypothetical protein